MCARRIFCCAGVFREKNRFTMQAIVFVFVVFVFNVSTFVFVVYVFGAIRWLSARVSSEKGRFTTQAAQSQFSLLFSHVRLASQCEQTNLTFVLSIGSQTPDIHGYALKSMGF